MLQLTLLVAADENQPPLDTLGIEQLKTMRDRAWRVAARAWADYRGFSRHSADPESRAVAQLLHDDAWAAEWWWRHLYDAVLERESSTD